MTKHVNIDDQSYFSHIQSTNRSHLDEKKVKCMSIHCFFTVYVHYLCVTIDWPGYPGQSEQCNDKLNQHSHQLLINPCNCIVTLTMQLWWGCCKGLSRSKLMNIHADPMSKQVAILSSHKIVSVNATKFFLIFRKCRKSSENTIRPSCNCFE